MQSLKNYVNALQSVTDKPNLIIMGDNPLCATLVLLHKSGLISAKPEGDPEHLTRISKCNITPEGALALFQWKRELKSETLPHKFKSAFIVCASMFAGCIITLATTEAYNEAKLSTHPQQTSESDNTPD